MPTVNYTVTALELLASYQEFLGMFEPAPAVRPGHWQPFKWPPKSDIHVRPEEWTHSSVANTPDGDVEVRWAKRGNLLIGQIDKYWVTASGATEKEIVGKLLKGVKPLFDRQREIGWLIGAEDRYQGTFAELSPVGLVRCLYAVDRDIVKQAALEIETHAKQAVFAPTLIAILEDRTHPQRRSAQWAVLDLFEDLPSFCPDPEVQEVAIEAIFNLMWDAPDDYVRTIYKGGIVLGGHICNEPASEALLKLFEAPSKFGRRAAYHASFHLAEWQPQLRDTIIDALRSAREKEPELILASYCADMANDIIAGGVDHVGDPIFPEDNP